MRVNKLVMFPIPYYILILIGCVSFAAILFGVKTFSQMGVLFLFIPVMCSIFMRLKEYGGFSFLFILFFSVYAAFVLAPAGEDIFEAESLALQIVMGCGSVLLGAIIIVARQQQKKLLEKRAFQQQKQQVINILQCFIPVGERKTQTSRKEINEMSKLLKALWKECGNGQSKDWEIDLLSLLHFVSRVKLPDYMFEKEGKLSTFELEVVEEHCYMAKELCEGVKGFEEVQNVFLHHHEKINGTGYPYRLNGDQIPKLSQMLGLVEVYLALTTPRSYRQEISKEEAYEEIQKLAGISFHEDIVKAFGKVLYIHTHS